MVEAEMGPLMYEEVRDDGQRRQWPYSGRGQAVEEFVGKWTGG